MNINANNDFRVSLKERLRYQVMRPSRLLSPILMRSSSNLRESQVWLWVVVLVFMIAERYLDIK